MEASLAKIRDLIYEDCGIYYSDINTNILESALKKRIEVLQLSGMDAYGQALGGAAGKKELEILLDKITINETSFFRTQPQLDVFRDTLLKELIEKKRQTGKKELKVWSAACSSGEEPYTMSIILHEVLGPELPEWRALVYASDISNKVLDLARKGCYGLSTLRNVPPGLKEKYFTRQDDETYQLSSAIRSTVNFERANLVADRLSPMAYGMDIILCRNVLIYFDDESRGKAIRNFYQALNPGGYLMIGPTESLYKVNHDFHLIHLNKAMAYQKV